MTTFFETESLYAIIPVSDTSSSKATFLVPHFCKNATTNRHRDFTIPFLHPPPLQNLHKTEHKVVSSQFILHLFFKKNPLTKCMWFTAGKKKCTPINKVDKAP